MSQFLNQFASELIKPYAVRTEYEDKVILWETREFINGFFAADHTMLPDDYVKSSERILLCTPQNAAGEHHVCGGILIQADEARFRTDLLLDAVGARNDSAWYAHDLVIEMNGLWMAPNLPELVRIGFWFEICAHLHDIYAGSTSIVMSYDTKKAGLDKFYRRFFPNTLYEGKVPVIEGMDPAYTTEERVCWASLHHIAGQAIPYAVERLKRLVARHPGSQSAPA